jgi:lipoprotein-releasing system permease protein
MSLSWALIVRFTVGGGQRGFTRVVALASLIGMILGVAALILVLSVMNGFAAELQKRLFSVTPDLIVEPAAPTEEVLNQWAERLTAYPVIQASSIFRQGTVLLQHGTRSRGVKLLAMDGRGLREVITLSDHIIAGDLDQLSYAPFTAVLGADVARLLGVAVGDEISVVLPRLTVTPLGIFPKSRTLEVVGVFEVGAQPDASVAYVSLETGDRLMGSMAGWGVQAKLTERARVDELTDQLLSLNESQVKITDWRASQGSLFAAIKMEKLTVAILLASVVLVAAFNLVSMLTMSVTEKRSDIAILQVLGLSPSRLLVIFLGHGLLLALAGIAIGTFLGVALAVSISDLSLWFERVLGWVLFDPAVYYIAGLPSELMWNDVTMVAAGALILSVMASLYPAWRASSVPPGEALNYV